ncbi:MAG TPA: ADP-ribosylglycohydrolase family protein [Firmicutes bacterium]|nr:ADP-ribosylglycohydrolase family protein [Bacillota bacterium]
MKITWIDPEELIEREFSQAREEGRRVSCWPAEWEKAKQNINEPLELRALAETFWNRLASTPPGPYERSEPSDLKGIFSLCSAPRSPLEVNLKPSVLEDKIKGGWLGRAAGCLLGKPVEGKPRYWIRELLMASNRWPLDDYFSAAGIPPEVFSEHTWHKSYQVALRENIICMPEDDDLNYTMLNLHTAEQFGPNFTSKDVLQMWLTALPVLQTFTAERVAYLNALQFFAPPETARWMNPYREWIGAQIRADLWGWITPGNPRYAAELAYRDAAISHTKNGIYGAMFVAALISACFAVDNVSDAILIALDYVPAESRLNEALRYTIDLCSTKRSFESAVDEIYAKFGHYHWVHTINNGALLVAALLYGDNDFEKTICYSVMGGWDTDSNGATAGSILGGLLGAKNIPHKWTGPLNNRIRTSLKGFDNSSFDNLAAKTLRLIDRFASTTERSESYD